MSPAGRRAGLDSHTHQRSDTLAVDRLEGGYAEDTLVEVRREKRRLDIITAEAHVVWVRSLVPNEKNCAASAIWPAVTAARGNSIMVPIGKRR